MHCRRFGTGPRTRREMLSDCANGFGAVALASLLSDPAFGAESSAAGPGSPLAPRPPQLKASATSVIFLFMDGGPSHVDTFDPKPRLDRENGRPFPGPILPSQFMARGSILKSPWEFRRYGSSSIPVSDLFPHV